MKNVSELKRQLDNIQEMDIDLLAPIMPSSAKQKNKAKFLSTCIQYLETLPDEDFIRKEIKRIDNRIHEAMRVYSCWVTDKKFDSKEKRLFAYRAHYNIPQMESQLETLKFLVNE